MSVLAAGVAVRVAVQSSQRLLRDTLAVCLAIRPDVTVVGRVAEADDVPDLCELSSPDVVILDAGRLLGEMAGRVGSLMRRFPDLNVIVIYREAAEEDLAAACRAGVSSLVPESHGLAAVLAQVRRRRARHARESQRPV
jgi:DNA-binding NarL/FixJ family response regulator